MRDTDVSSRNPYGLSESEKKWVKIQPFLDSKGYELRPRYRQGWQPSWPENASLGVINRSEDRARMLPKSQLLDATRKSDGMPVMIKRVPSNSQEVDIGRFFSSNQLRSDPANHCVPFLDDFEDPFLDELSGPEGESYHFIVMPLLRKWKDPPLRTHGELVDFIGQILEGLVFMHAHNVAHRDAATANIMMDATAMYPDGFHPYEQDYSRDFSSYARRFTRTQARPTYYFIDFGISTMYEDDEPHERVTGRSGRVKAPELSYDVPYDPFPVDIFALGTFLNDLVDTMRDLEYLQPLATAMMSDVPSERPSAEAVFDEFNRIQASRPPGQSQMLLFTQQQGILVRMAFTAIDIIGRLSSIVGF